ncbi:hypothetical protein CEUSTIGMA_g1192.t1 [Chlamydomonas eustigma]|uniref:Cytidyltransferase-like domain-containing protein n=1 Tax=Chlamydomonas eustigma TaxID=1157962 RepID=A0A250WSR3_9CHLO|nr:hypothetical protein CEUSTIGMA_g1192.t1 [Chlamydomonas eustigma]|eukprot:GAX73739.1 hypothetical protein CEUSTIGMA_g1192.t1 [Chlamydomonas eustigma]
MIGCTFLKGADVPRVLLLCGGDVLATMAMPGVWKDPHILLEEFGVVCLERGEHRYAEQLKLNTDSVSTSFISVEGSFGQILGLPPTGTSQDISDSAKDSETASPLKDFLRRFKDQIFFVDSDERDGQILTTPDLSSTIVRAALKSGEPVHDLIDSDVEAYIREHALYRAPC